MKSFGFRIALCLLFAASPPTVCAWTLPADSLAAISAPATDRYAHRVEREHRIWNALIPRQAVVQGAGNMGLLSFGVGWCYGRRDQWETDLLLGFIPKYDSSRPKTTMTLKENFQPWHLRIGQRGWGLEPLSCGLYINTVFGHEFWQKQPSRYPKGYYTMLSTKFRANVFLGQRATYEIPPGRRRFLRSVTAFYEVSTCDLYIRSMFQDSSVRLHDIIGLSLGVKLQLF